MEQSAQLNLVDAKIVGGALSLSADYAFAAADMIVQARGGALWACADLTDSGTASAVPLAREDWQVAIAAGTGFRLQTEVAAEQGAHLWVLRPPFKRRHHAILDLVTLDVGGSPALLHQEEPAHGVLAVVVRDEAVPLLGKWANAAYDVASLHLRSARNLEAVEEAELAVDLAGFGSLKHLSLLLVALRKAGEHSRGDSYIDMFVRTYPALAADIEAWQSRTSERLAATRSDPAPPRSQRSHRRSYLGAPAMNRRAG